MAKEADFRELEKFLENWTDAYNDFDDFLRKFLLEMALRAVAKIVGNTPEDTGALRNSWGVGNQALQVGRTKEQAPSAFEQAATIESVEVVGDSFEITIFNLMNYASFVEFGHRFRDGRWNNGRFMMTVGIDQVQKQIPARWNKAFKAYLQSKGAN